jgi:N-acetylmuramoyl-L-alanine amidase
MKKTMFVCAMAVVMGFLAAVGLCVRALGGVGAVSAFDTGLRVVIDAGHGGIDGGVVGRKTGKRESDINLEIAYALRGVLEEMGFDVTMTRKTQAGLYDTTAKGFKKRDMEKRREIIREAKPDFVLSIHQNFYPVSVYRGGQAFYPVSETENAGNAGSKRLAEILQTKMNGLYAEENVKVRKVAQGDFFILRCYDCPSVLLECGFLSNAADEALLCQPAWRKKLAQNIASGLIEYLAQQSA